MAKHGLLVFIFYAYCAYICGCMLLVGPVLLDVQLVRPLLLCILTDL